MMKTMMKKTILVATAILLVAIVQAQSLTQTVRGTIADKVSQTPLPGVNIIVEGIEPLLGASTDMDGNFRITNVPVGTHQLKISFMGYTEKVMTVVVNSGKEPVLNISMEESAQELNEVVVKATAKNKPVNEMSVVSTRSFSVEETQKYAAAVNDPARMVTAYAGVVGTDDGNNSISIRGNTPNGLLWRMEGVDIPNPNHFANAASAGGGIMILSSQLLSNSDFSTGAFNAEYGNALSGVFDIKLRKGNNEKREYTFQASVLGIDAAVEGPFSKKYKGSYLINYRYSTLTILEKAGILPDGASTNFQDLGFNIYLPAGKAGNFSLFGFGGLSKQFFNAEKDSSAWKENYDRNSWNFKSNTGAAGLKHNYIINEKTYLQSAIVFSGNENGFEEKRFNDNYEPELRYEENGVSSKITFSSIVNHKVNAKLHSKSGVYVNQLFFNITDRWWNEGANAIEERIGSEGNTQTVQAFSQWSWKLTPKLMLNGGLHALYLALNNSNSIEPRLSAQYQFNAKNSMSFGYGLHSQLQPLGTYFAKVNVPETGTTLPNKNLDFTKSHHFVLGYTHNIKDNMYLKAETYYQHLYNIPISSDPTNTTALINREWGFEIEPLVNNGIGRNMGLELTLEQFMQKGFYYIVSGSLYDSKYRAADDNWYDTRFNGGFALSFAGGKEFTPNKKNKNRTYGINLKGGYNGGFRMTPIDLEASRAKGEQVTIDNKAFTEKLPNYFRADLRLSMKRMFPRVTHTAAIDFQNVINRQNVFIRYYHQESGSIKTLYQNGLIPVLSYRLEF